MLTLLCLLALASPMAPLPTDCEGMTLTVTDPMVGGQTVDVDITGVAGGAEPVLLFINNFQNPIPAFGCTWTVDLVGAVELLLVADTNGEISLSGTFPTGFPAGLPFYWQALAEDDPPTLGYQTSNVVLNETG